MRRALIGLMVTMISSGITACDRGAPAHAEPPPVPLESSEPPADSAPAPVPTAAPPPPPPAPAPPQASAASEPVAAVETPLGGRLDHIGNREEELVQPPPGPTGTVTLGRVSVSGMSVADATLFVGRMRAGFRNCYNKSLQNDPRQRGELGLTIQVESSGNVRAVEAVPSGVLSAPLVNCVKARARAAHFNVPEGGSGISGTVTVTVTFAPP